MGRKRKPKLLKELQVTGIADKGKGVLRDEEGRVIFVEDVVPGDVIDVLVYKKKKSFFLGKVEQFHSYSSDRVSPFCDHFGVCGGCKFQHMNYEAQLYQKNLVVENALLRIGKIEVADFQPIVGCESTTYYRNKLEFSFSNKKWLTREQIDSGVSNLENVLGFHKAGAFDKIIDIKHCWLQPAPSNEIRNTIRKLAIDQGLTFYDARTHEGFLRNMVVRVTSTGELMIIISFGNRNQEKIDRLVNGLLEEFQQITALYICINEKVNDFLLDLDMELVHGKPCITEQLGHVSFNIGPKSFFQTNTAQAKTLYDTVVEFAQLKGNENVYDLYTGIGSIGLYLAKNCKQIVGIEEVEAAIEDAKQNAALNNIDNAVFYAGDVKSILTEEFAQKHSKPDVLITDPPRAGMHPKVVEMLLNLKSPKIVYVSCNPATQARDLNLLKESYTIEKVRPVDMFPHTHHIETVALLHLKPNV